MPVRLTTATLVAASIVLAACGSGSADLPAAAPAPAADQATAGDGTATGSESATASTSEISPVEDPPATDAPAATDSAASEDDAPTTEPEPDASPPSVMWPDDGCSADNSPTPTDVAEGPAPLLEVRSESVDSPLPDLAVRRINCNGGWVNLRNELPSDQPLLVWFWAPH